jgi:hypothetical protein
MPERRQPDVLSAGDQCGVTIAHIKSVSGKKRIDEEEVETQTRGRRRCRGGLLAWWCLQQW